VKLDVGDGSPVEFKGGASGVSFDGGAVELAEDVELVVVEVDGGGVVGLKGWAGLGGDLWAGENKEQKNREACDGDGGARGRNQVRRAMVIATVGATVHEENIATLEITCVNSSLFGRCGS